MMTLTWIILGIIALGIIWLIWAYNTLVNLKHRVEESWSDIDVQLKRRYDLIPNMIEAVKAYAKHESTVFEKVTQARTAAMGAQNPLDKALAENALSATLKSLFAVSENYPELRASENFAKLQDELSDTENKIQAARRFYNTNVLSYNVQLGSFPVNLVAGPFGFSERPYFETEETSREPVQVKI